MLVGSRQSGGRLRTGRLLTCLQPLAVLAACPGCACAAIGGGLSGSRLLPQRPMLLLLLPAEGCRSLLMSTELAHSDAKHTFTDTRAWHCMSSARPHAGMHCTCEDAKLVGRPRAASCWSSAESTTAPSPVSASITLTGRCRMRPLHMADEIVDFNFNGISFEAATDLVPSFMTLSFIARQHAARRGADHAS